VSGLTEISSISPQDYTRLGFNKERLVWMLRKMIEIRLFEEKVEELYLMRGLITGPAHLYFGEEAVAVGVMSALDPNDYVISGHRGHGHALAKEISPKLIMAELFGKSTGTCKGLGGSMHVGICLEKNSLFASAIVGSGIPIASGVGLALKHKKSDRVVAAFFGDGATNTGAFHEGINLSAIWRLPVIFVCENNMYAIGMKTENAVATKSIAIRATAYGIRGISADGNDPVAVHEATKRAIEIAHSGGGSTLIECKTYRQKGHGVYDKALYRPKEEVEEWLKKDPIINFQNKLIASQIVSQEELDKIKSEVLSEIEEAVKFAQESPVLPFGELGKLVYA